MGEEKNSILDKIPEEIKLYNTLYLQYKKYGEEARNTLDKIIDEYKGLDDLVSDGFDTSLDIVKTYIDDAIYILKNMEVKNITEEEFMQKYYQKYCTFGEIFNDLENQYKKIEKLNYEKSLKEKNEIFKSKEVRNNILNSVESSVVDIHEAILDCVENETKKELYRVTIDDKKEAQKLLSKLKTESNLLSYKEKLGILGKMLGSDPYLEDTYVYLLDINQGDNDNQMEEYANYFGIDLAKKKSEIINKEIDRYLEGNLEDVDLKDKKAKLISCLENYFAQKYKEKNSYANKVYLDNLKKVFDKASQKPELNEEIKELIEDCNYIYDKYSDERFLNIKNKIESTLLNSTKVLDMRNDTYDEIETERQAKEEYKLEVQKEKPKHEVDLKEETEKSNNQEPIQNSTTQHQQSTQQSQYREKTEAQLPVYQEYAVAVVECEEKDKKGALWYTFKIASIVLMLFSGGMLLGLLTGILDEKAIATKDLILAYIMIGTLFGLSLVCNSVANKKTYPHGKSVSNKSIIIRIFIGILCFVGGVVFDTTYIKAVFFTLTIMIILYIIRDCLFRHND